MVVLCLLCIFLPTAAFANPAVQEQVISKRTDSPEVCPLSFCLFLPRLFEELCYVAVWGPVKHLETFYVTLGSEKTVVDF